MRSSISYFRTTDTRMMVTEVEVVLKGYHQSLLKNIAGDIWWEIRNFHTSRRYKIRCIRKDSF